MGYNSWYDLMGTLTEESIKATADKMVELGLVELGYNYLNLLCRLGRWLVRLDSARG